MYYLHEPLVYYSNVCTFQLNAKTGTLICVVYLLVVQYSYLKQQLNVSTLFLIYTVAILKEQWFLSWILNLYASQW